MRYLTAMTIFTLLGGCGQTGALYLPGEEPPRSRPTIAPAEPAQESATETDDIVPGTVEKTD